MTDTFIHRIVVLDTPTSIWSILGVVATFAAVFTAVFTALYLDYKRKQEDIQLSIRLRPANGPTPRENVELTITNISPIRYSIIENITWLIDGKECKSIGLTDSGDFEPIELDPLKKHVVIVFPWSDTPLSTDSEFRLAVRTRGEKSLRSQRIPLMHRRFRWSIKLTKNERAALVG